MPSAAGDGDRLRGRAIVALAPGRRTARDRARALGARRRRRERGARASAVAPARARRACDGRRERAQLAWPCAHPARADDAHRDLHRRHAQLRHVGPALRDGAVRRRRALLAQREQQVERAGLARRRAGRELARALHGARHGVRVVVGQDARGLEQHLGVEPALLQQVGRGARLRGDRREQVPGGHPFASALRHFLRQPAQRGELRFTGPGHRTSARTTSRGGPTFEPGPAHSACDPSLATIESEWYLSAPRREPGAMALLPLSLAPGQRSTSLRSPPWSSGRSRPRAARPPASSSTRCPAARRRGATSACATRSGTAVAMFVPEGAKAEEIAKPGEHARWPFLEVRDLLAVARRRRPRGLRARTRRAAGSCSRTWATTPSPPSSAPTPTRKASLYVRAVDAISPAPRRPSPTLPPGERRGVARVRRGLAPLGDRSTSASGGSRRAASPLSAGRPRALRRRSPSASRRAIAAWPRVFVHRDYQSRNLMVRDARTGALCWIDFQDALLGPRVYDLVALLNDSYQDVRSRLRRGAPRRRTRRAAGLATPERAASRARVRPRHRAAQAQGRRAASSSSIASRSNPSFLKFVEPTIAQGARQPRAPRATTRTCARSPRSSTRLLPGYGLAAPSPPDRRPRAPLAPRRVRLRPHGLDLGDGRGAPALRGRDALLAPPAARVARRARGDARDGPPARRHLRPLGRRTRSRPASSTSASATRASTSRASSRWRTSVGLKVRPAPRAAHQRRAHVLRPPRAHRVGPRSARRARRGGHPVMLPDRPGRVPGSELRERRLPRRDRALVRAPSGERLARLRWPEGPIVLVQVDNEGALYFRDGQYDQDYHPDAIDAVPRVPPREVPRAPPSLRDGVARRRARLRRRVEPPRRASTRARRDDLAAPRRLGGVPRAPALHGDGPDGRVALVDAGFDGLPTTHNLPLGESATPLNPARMTAHRPRSASTTTTAPRPTEHWTILRRTTELAARCEGRERPAFGAEVGAGFPAVLRAARRARLALHAHRRALAYGLRGFNLYMAVERDRWIGAPIDPHGTPRPFAAQYARLARRARRDASSTRSAAARRCASSSRARCAASRASTHAFGPAHAGALQRRSARAGARACLERDFGLDAPPVDRGRGVPARVRAGAPRARRPLRVRRRRDRRAARRPARSGSCARARGGLKPHLVEQPARGARDAARIVTIGPRVPELDGVDAPAASARST